MKSNVKPVFIYSYRKNYNILQVHYLCNTDKGVRLKRPDAFFVECYDYKQIA